MGKYTSQYAEPKLNDRCLAKAKHRDDSLIGQSFEDVKQREANEEAKRKAKLMKEAEMLEKKRKAEAEAREKWIAEAAKREKEEMERLRAEEEAAERRRILEEQAKERYAARLIELEKIRADQEKARRAESRAYIQSIEDKLEEIRKEKTIPVIMLSAKSEDYDKIEGLNAGADDYITKPFNPLELIARVNSNIRRYTKLGAMSEKKSEKKENVYQTGELILDDETKKVTSEGKKIKLTATEFKILKFLMKNKGKVYSIPEIYENVWKEESYGAENIIAVHIRHIREKIEINPKEPKYLKVIWGIGYKIEDIK